jgi:hypothetical protein
VQELHAGGLRGGGDQQVGVSDAALVGAAPVSQFAVDINGAAPLRLACLERPKSAELLLELWSHS